ncbi:nucleotidyltransferase substrate binding protein, HI0074 family [Desulfurobacterium pacificum]|uniref:Nucleotidyltransferase substrate binding protein, HI0074 family n=1 Tax=Desulfurobacterium pacificum TaxID=240166 RepID=A0ABY1NKS2_9BACT|nr:nucleotidyltransferase substrate binding protein [Desulfurobacterium pacificum]SMP10224.1 nucleotidyltransferase substrate binding protein, HI0074 family [Desulfurobacterium pacificum]
MEKVEVLLYVEKLKNAVSRLEEAINRVKDDLDRDGAIQRFEFTVELLWKTLRRVLEYNKLECFSPRDCVKKAFRHGIIKDDEIILDMLEDRNLSSHIYNEEKAKEIFERISKIYIKFLKKILKEIENKI